MKNLLEALLKSEIKTDAKLEHSNGGHNSPINVNLKGSKNCLVVIAPNMSTAKKLARENKKTLPSLIK
jgi:hypothetical protein